MVITAFPERLSREEGDYLILDHALSSIRGGHPNDEHALVVQLLHVFVNAIGEPFNSGLNESLVSIFESEIAYQVLPRKVPVAVLTARFKLITEQGQGASPSVQKLPRCSHPTA